MIRRQHLYNPVREDLTALLEVRYLTALMKRDAEIWRQRTADEKDRRI